MTHIEVVEADLARADHARDIVAMLDAYSRDPMGNGRPLSPEVCEAIVPGLRRLPTTVVFLAYEVDGAGGDAGEAGRGTAVGIAVCFVGFSTFAARTLINIHDLAVAPTHRGRGISRMLMEAVERKARAMGACKITLEVLENNVRARSVYAEAGFVSASYGDTPGGAQFLWKPLS